MTAEPENSVAAVGEDDQAFEEKEEFKCYIGRVPTKFTEEIVQRILVQKLGGTRKDGKDADSTNSSAIVEKVELIYPHDDEAEDGNNNSNNNNNSDGYRADRNKSEPAQDDDNEEKVHRGFGFVSFSTAEFRDKALQLGTVKGGRKPTSKKLHTMYLRPYVAKSYDDDDGDPAAATTTEEGTTDANTMGRDVCYLWSLKRCPYGNDCKFRHVGEGGCLQREADLSPEEQQRLRRKRKGKCFVYKKKGSCPKGDDCPFSHDFEPNIVTATNTTTTTTMDSSSTPQTQCVVVPASVSPSAQPQKDCINWKTKGKCRKGEKCPYKHDPLLQQKALAKIAKRKRLRENGGKEEETADDTNHKKRRHKEKQPLSVRIFGMNYETTQADLKEFLEATCGHPVQSMIFPTFEDSNRSKGYCGVYFASPKAAQAAVETCDNAELHGRWLRVQTGKSMTVEAWEGLHHTKSSSRSNY